MYYYCTVLYLQTTRSTAYRIYLSTVLVLYVKCTIRRIELRSDAVLTIYRSTTKARPRERGENRPRMSNFCKYTDLLYGIMAAVFNDA